MKENTKNTTFILIQDNITLKMYNTIIPNKSVIKISDFSKILSNSIFDNYDIYQVKLKLNYISKEGMNKGLKYVKSGNKKGYFQCLGYKLKDSPNIVYLYVDYERALYETKSKNNI